MASVLFVIIKTKNPDLVGIFYNIFLQKYFLKKYLDRHRIQNGTVPGILTRDFPQSFWLTGVGRLITGRGVLMSKGTKSFLGGMYDGGIV